MDSRRSRRKRHQSRALDFRELDRRSVIIPLAIVAYVAHLYVRSIPTAGNDLVLIGLLGSVGLALGIAGGLATQVRAGENGHAVARVGWIAGGLLIAGICARMMFAFALSHGARHAIVSFSSATRSAPRRGQSRSC